jgi:hypothetical protein
MSAKSTYVTGPQGHASIGSRTACPQDPRHRSVHTPFEPDWNTNCPRNRDSLFRVAAEVRRQFLYPALCISASACPHLKFELALASRLIKPYQGVSRLKKNFRDQAFIQPLFLDFPSPCKVSFQSFLRAFPLNDLRTLGRLGEPRRALNAFSWGSFPGSLPGSLRRALSAANPSDASLFACFAPFHGCAPPFVADPPPPLLP